tara:strand:- start:2609 stop:3922 length:1314 start_codon:yes stop_codon:yes gene_type:complete
MAQNLFGTSLAEVQKAAFEAQEKRRQQAGLMAGQNSQSPALASGLGQAFYQMASTMGSGGRLSAAEQLAAAQEAKSKEIQAIFADPNGTREDKLALADQLVNSGNKLGAEVGQYYGKRFRDEIEEETRTSELTAALQLSADNRKEDQQQRLYGYKKLKDGTYEFDGTTVKGDINTDHPVEGNYYSTKPPSNTGSTNITNKFGDEYDSKLMKETITDLREGLTVVNNSLASLRAFRSAAKQLDDPKTDIILGAGAEIKTNLLKAFQSIGFGGPKSKKAIADTEAFLALMRQSSATLLGSGAFGAGTGVSDRDLKEVKAIVGADQALTKDGVRLILKVRAAMEIYKIKEYEESLEYQKPRVWKAVDQDKGYYYRSKAIPKYWQQPDPSGEDASIGKGWREVNTRLPLSVKEVESGGDMGGTGVTATDRLNILLNSIIKG